MNYMHRLHQDHGLPIEKPSEDVFDLPDEARVSLSEAKHVPNYRQDQYDDAMEAEYDPE